MAEYAINPDGEYEAFLLDLGLRGDLDGDEQLDITDINQLTDAIADATDDLKFDVNWSGTIDETDLDSWVHSAKKTFFGDANLDDQFNTGDLVQVLGARKYETQEHAGWGEGDWNGDGVFDTGDLVKALDDGGYEMGPRGNAVAVPEPTGWLLLIMGLLPGLRRRLARGAV